MLDSTGAWVEITAQDLLFLKIFDIIYIGNKKSSWRFYLQKLICWRSIKVIHLTCNEDVAGSSPVASSVI